ncbi:MAG TPA: hypothetical protein VHT34_02220 [Clostridia bacterium]|nr:hypothetical protein [Clostridia bacterium]
MSSVLNEKGHLTVNKILSIKSCTLSEDDLIEALEHISDCEACGAILSDSYDEAELIKAPSGFSEEVIQKILPKQVTKRQFVLYSIRVGIAACAALAVISFGSFNFLTDISSKGGSIPPPNLSFVNTINIGLKDFSHKILKMEVFKK